MIDTPDTTLHKLTLCYNSIPRNAVGEAVRRTGYINQSLADKHVIIEPENSRKNVTQEVFEKMTKIEGVVAVSNLSKYLGAKQLQLTSELQQAKIDLKDATKSSNNIEFVNDMIK